MEEESALATEFAASDAKPVQDARDEAENFNDPKWNPDPIDAPPGEPCGHPDGCCTKLTGYLRLSQEQRKRRDSDVGQHLRYERCLHQGVTGAVSATLACASELRSSQGGRTRLTICCDRKREVFTDAARAPLTAKYDCDLPCPFRRGELGWLRCHDL